MPTKNTMKKAFFLREHPEVVSDMYELSAHGNKFADVSKKINDAFPDKEFICTEHVVRHVFHQIPPFSHPNMFSLVDPETKAAVESKFRGPKKTKAVKTTVKFSPAASPDDRLEALDAVTSAHLQYEKAILAAIELGMSRDNLESLAGMTTEAVLRVEKIDG